MKTNTRAILYFIAGVMVCAVIITGIALKKIDPGTTAVDVSKEGRPQYKWYAPPVPASIDFAGENVPLDRWDVKEKLDRELLVNAYQHGSQLYIMKLAGRYFPIIEARLKANGVPDDFKYVCLAESALQQNALSGVGAASFWQFMKDTGPAYGLEINDEVDERFNVLKATDGACKYIKTSFGKFGTWTAAAASYNCGQAGYQNQADFQEATNYYDLIFPDETNRYLYRILALKYIYTHPKAFGLVLESGEEYQQLKSKTIVVDKSIDNLTTFAKANGSSYKMLKIYNPWLRAHKLTVKPGKRYDIALPL
jgi:membrane-bound lytic murein transglycosylase D